MGWRVIRTAKKERMTLVVFSGNLDKVYASFILANTAASMGMDVTMFFTFWGLNVITKKGAKIRGGLKQKMFSLINKTGPDRTALSKFHMLGIGTSMIKKLMKDYKMMSIPEMIRLAHEQGVKMLACSTTMAMFGLTKDSFLPEVEAVVGAATYISEAKGASINLFI